MPAKTVKPAVRAKRARADVEKEFAEIQEQVESAREARDTKAEETARVRETEIRGAVEGVTVEGIVQRISGLGLEVARALSDISAELTDETQLLASVREAVALERKELERLHKIDIAATALDQMIQDYMRENSGWKVKSLAQRPVWEQWETDRVERDRREQVKRST